MTLPNESAELRHASLATLRTRLQAGARRLEVRGLLGSAEAFVVASLVSAETAPLLVVAPDQGQARRFATDLRFFVPEPEGVVFFPQWEVGPYEPLDPHPEVEAARLAALAALDAGRARVVVAPVRALQQRVVPRSLLAARRVRLEAGHEVARDRLMRVLLELGYQPTPLVEDRGTFSLRGDILDLFPAERSEPLRVEFFGDMVERIRRFDPGSQRSLGEPLTELELVPVRELALAGADLERFERALRGRCEELGLPRTRREALLEELRTGVLSPGRAFLLPYNYARLDTLFDYLDMRTWVVLDPAAVEQESQTLWSEARQNAARREAEGEVVAPPEALYLSPEALAEQGRAACRIELPPLALLRAGTAEILRFDTQGNGDLAPRHGGRGTPSLAPLATALAQWQRERWRVLLVCHQAGQAERLAELLAPYQEELELLPEQGLAAARPGVPAIVIGDLSAGFRLPGEALAVITEEEVFGQAAPRRRQGVRRARANLSSLAQLRSGDYVVHVDHGIGRYLGLEHLVLGRDEGDFLHLEYAGGDRLYLPVERIEKVQKYIGVEGQAPRLDRMGGEGWERAVLKARAAIELLARDLLKLQAQREMRGGLRFSAPGQDYREFEATFEYEETPDQLSAIADVMEDMSSERPMDRLICGDVGYGKTEVAIRAAFRAVLDGRQVAVLVPTTVLASQHWQNFRQRFRDYPVTVEMVSRFRTPAEQREVLERTREGRVDILIGTHRLLQRDVRFRDLGLIIIDEEQRFGVAHKERLKQFRAEVDVLTLTATPIPRTLHMSLVGVRDLSLIETPPVDRLAIRTYVTRFEDELVRNAILRELRRGGQVFFVHNRVETIGAVTEQLRHLVPEARIAVAHGQMGEKALEEVMLEFVTGRANLLVCTAIIENGLDIPRANTILIDRADCFGLSQLYQLRGRVGRSRERAFAYLLIPGEAALSTEARERLRVLQELTELGAGFRIASHDLELRGAGDLLGARQSGQIAAVGFELYTELLEEMVAELRGLEREDQIDPEVRLGQKAFLPESYVADPNLRLALYQRLARAENETAVVALGDELRERFGELPPPARELLEVMQLRTLMKGVRVTHAEYDGRQLVFSFHQRTPVPPEAILALLRDNPDSASFSPDYRLALKLAGLPPAEALRQAKKALRGFLQLC